MEKTERMKRFKYLKHGDISKIAELSGCAISTVSNWIHGHHDKSGCAPYFESLTDKRKAEVEKSMNEI